MVPLSSTPSRRLNFWISGGGMNGSLSPLVSAVEISRMKPNFLSPISSSMPWKGSPGWPPPFWLPLSDLLLLLRLRFLRRRPPWLPSSESSSSDGLSASEEPLASSSSSLSLEATGSASRVRRRRRLGASSASSPDASSLAGASAAGSSFFVARVRRFLAGSGALSSLEGVASEALPLESELPPVRSITWARLRRFLGAASGASAASSGALVFFAMEWRVGDTGRGCAGDVRDRTGQPAPLRGAPAWRR